MLLLSIDTSTRGCSVSLRDEKGTIACYELYTDRSSSAMLTTLMKSITEDAGFQLKDLDAIAVAKGPGSYTGLRVGVSTAKGLCYALDKPMIAINTLEAMAVQVAGFYPDYLLCPMIDARRMEVYTAVFDHNNQTILPTEALILENDSFAGLLAENKIVFFGDGSAKCRPLLETNPNAIFIEQSINPSARTIGELAVNAFVEGLFENVVTFEPYYLKDFMSPAARKTNPVG